MSSLKKFEKCCENIVINVENSKISKSKLDSILKSIEELKSVFKSQNNELNKIKLKDKSSNLDVKTPNESTQYSTQSSTQKSLNSTMNSTTKLLDLSVNDSNENIDNKHSKESFSKLSTDEKLELMFDKIIDIELKQNQQTVHRKPFNRFRRQNNWQNKQQNNNQQQVRPNFINNNNKQQKFYRTKRYENRNYFNQQTFKMRQNFVPNFSPNPIPYYVSLPSTQQPFIIPNNSNRFLGPNNANHYFQT
jgi:tRNA G10  N-methylase Trm11